MLFVAQLFLAIAILLLFSLRLTLRSLTRPFIYLNYPALPGTFRNPTKYGLQRAQHIYVHTATHKIGAWMMQPEEQCRNRKIFLYVHGNASHRAKRAKVELCKILQSRGNGVIIIDNSGFGDSEGSANPNNLQNDLAATWAYLTEIQGYSPSQIVLVGHSLGTAIITEFAMSLQERNEGFGGLVLLAPFPDIVTVAMSFPYFPIGRFIQMICNEEPFHQYFARRIDNFDGGSRIAHLECPILIIHGTDDAVIPPHLSRGLIASSLESDNCIRRLIGEHEEWSCTGQGGREVSYMLLTGASHDNLETFPVLEEAIFRMYPD